MKSQIVTLSLLVFFGSADADGPNAGPQDMNKKIKHIARGIVDKWVDEGLTVTREKVERWINIVDESQAKAKAEQQRKQPQKPPADGLGDDFNQVKDTLVKTFTKIGQVQCTDCKKPSEAQNSAAGEDQRLEAMSLEELEEKQELIRRFAQMSKMAQLAKLAGSFQNLGNLKNMVQNSPQPDSVPSNHEEL
ncbi:uncharacterized protein LOC109536601 [Dendroctonus ponderosae]|uniref:uncharacterized protein LOC109536601 n=1 Tax=Dendroctonus ponderosae TaxID=77166 RepID=UPI0020361CEE|nr:uncharacterized protein LOC109536601 [Dendroctonus ponderosae]KAH1026148.1 hypothetical protein HUJ05_010710 [Dendroctonus ponderosae]